MATWTYVEATELNFPNLTVWKKLRDGVHMSWRVTPVEGYVMYNPNANDTELDPETMIERPVTYYYTSLDCPLNTNWDTFAWLAVPRSSVDENYIFGLPTNPPEAEVM